MKDEIYIAFVPRRSRIRPYKIAKALRYLKGVRTILICEERFYDPSLHDSIFDKVRFYKQALPFSKNKYVKILDDRLNPKHSRLARIVQEEAPDLIHAFCEPYDHIQYLLEHVDIPVVMSDGADFSGISEGIEHLDRRTRKQERFCFENVHGICHKGPPYELEYYREYGYKVDCPEIRWFDHCDEELFVDPQRVKKLSTEDGEQHIVYTGLVSDDPNKGYINYIPLAYAMEEQGVHLHIYSNPYLERTNHRYRELDRVLHYFHLHDPLPYKEIGNEIARYDWGLWWHEPTGERRVTPAKQKVAIGNKMFAYLEAGLPIIVGSHNGGGRPIIEEKGIGITMDKGDYPRLGKVLNDIDKERMDERVIQVRKELSISANADRLMQYYPEVLKYFYGGE